MLDSTNNMIWELLHLIRYGHYDADPLVRAQLIMYYTSYITTPSDIVLLGVRFI